MNNLIGTSMRMTLHSLTHMITDFLPRLIAMAVIIIVGGFIAWIIKLIVRWILRVVQFNRLCETAGFTQLLAKAALPSPAELLSRLVFWVIWVTFILLGLNALGIMALQEEISRFFLFLPQIFVAILILFIGVLIANFCGRAALLAAVNSDWPSPRFLSSLVRFLIIILAVTMALERIGLGRGVVLIAFSIGFGAVALALALAFGLGGRDAARRLLEGRFSPDPKRERRPESDDEGISHL
jgi:small-conductance mechanosensitive channel